MVRSTVQLKQPNAETKKRRWTFEHTKFAVEVIGMIALIAAVAGTYLTVLATNRSVDAAKDAIQLSTKQLGETQYESVYQHQLDLWRLAAENRDLAPYIVGGKKPQDQVSDVEARRASQDAAIYNALDFYAYAFEQLAPRDGAGNHSDDALTSEEKPSNYTYREWGGWKTWAATIVSGFQSAPAMCDELNQTVNGHYYYDEVFRAAVSKAVPNCVK
jgi:hypothetical protein